MFNICRCFGSPHKENEFSMEMAINSPSGKVGKSEWARSIIQYNSFVSDLVTFVHQIASIILGSSVETSTSNSIEGLSIRRISISEEIGSIPSPSLSPTHSTITEQPAEPKALPAAPVETPDKGEIISLTDIKVLELCNKYHLRPDSNAHFRMMLQLHVRVWEGSETYREIVEDIEKRAGCPVTFIDLETAISQLKSSNKSEQAEWLQDNFQFRACWLNDLNAVVIMKPDELDEADIGSTMVFEMTNGFQQSRFDQVHDDALEGNFIDMSTRDQQLRLDRAAKQYAFAMENIENDGRDIHARIIDQAIKSGKIDSDWSWSENEKDDKMSKYQRIHVNMIGTEYGQSHMEYYEDAYKTNIAPFIQKKQANPSGLKERMDKLRLASQM